MTTMTTTEELYRLAQNNKTFVRDQFYVDGVIACKYISSIYSEQTREKYKSEKLKFELVNDQINDSILAQLKNKELYFLKKTKEVGEVGEVRGQNFYPLKVKSFLNCNDCVTLSNIQTAPDSTLVLTKIIGEKTQTCMTISENVTNISLKVKLDMNEKIIKPLKSNSQTKLSINELMELIKSEKLRLRVRIECGAVYINDTLYISATLTKINLEQSKMVEIYSELKEREAVSISGKKKLIPKNKLYISQFPKKSSTITNNIVDIIMGNKPNEFI